MTDLPDKPTLLQRIRESYSVLETALARFDADQMITPHPPDGWSVKDIMAHITFWERYALERLQEVGRGETPQMLGDITDDDVNRINQEALEAGRARTLDDVSADFARVHADLWAEVQALPDDSDTAWWARWPAPEVGKQIIIYNTYDHYQEHIDMMREWA
jgi:uncharacterized protein (TIGR03083 family)